MSHFLLVLSSLYIYLHHELDFFAGLLKKRDSYCAYPSVGATLWLSFCMQVGISKTTEGNGLKLHILI
jgi:hypothetical protein